MNAATGDTKLIDLGGVPMTNGDGLLRRGSTLYVVQNQSNQIAVIQLGRHYSTGRVVRTITDPDFQVPTTVAAFGKSLYAVNARFGVPNPGAAEYTVVKVPKR